MKLSLVPLMMLLVVSPAFSVPVATGSGTVHFEFTSFDGAYGYCDTNPRASCITGYYMTGLTSQVSFDDLTWSGPYSGDRGTITIGVVPEGVATFDSGVTEVKFGDSASRPNTTAENILRFTPANFTNIELGQEFKIGTIFYQNGSWAGGTPDSADNIPSNFSFRLWTESADPGFTWEITGIIQQVVNSPDPFGYDTEEKRINQADWITIISPYAAVDFELFKVFDKTAFTGNSGSIDVMARFNSLDLLGFSNPQGDSFLAASAVPISSTTSLVGIGLLALIAVWRGRRRADRGQSIAV